MARSTCSRGADMDKHIHCLPDDQTAWICLCGNTPDSEGFAPCEPSGKDIEPTVESGWAGLYRCDRCQRIIDQRDRHILSSAFES
jgi:hypothetical protein